MTPLVLALAARSTRATAAISLPPAIVLRHLADDINGGAVLAEIDGGG